MDLERSQLSGNTSTYLNISRHTVYIYMCVCVIIYIYTHIWTLDMRISGCPWPNLQRQDMSLMNFSAELNNQKLSISAVDKRSTAIVTPLPGTARFSGATWVGKSPNYCKWSSIAGKTKGNHGNSMKIIYEKKVYSREKHQTRRGIVQLAMFDIPT